MDSDRQVFKNGFKMLEAANKSNRILLF